MADSLRAATRNRRSLRHCMPLGFRRNSDFLELIPDKVFNIQDIIYLHRLLPHYLYSDANCSQKSGCMIKMLSTTTEKADSD